MAKINTPDFLTPLPKSVVKVTLPSRGILYKEGPAASGRLNLIPMTLAEENLIIASIASGGDGTNVALKKCIQEHLDINYLLSSDKFFLFLMLRVLTYGRDYSFNWTCNALTKDRSVCSARNRSTVIIPDSFNIKYLADEDKEPFEITLPESGKVIGFRLRRAYDEKDIERFEKQIQQDVRQGINRGASSDAYSLAKLLVHVEHNEITPDINIDDVMKWLLSLPAKDIAFYADRLDYYTPGLDTSVRLECGSCGFIHDMSVPITSEFFRPKFSQDERPVGNLIRPDVLLGTQLPGNSYDPNRGTDVAPRETSPGEAGRVRVRESEAGSDNQGNNNDGAREKVEPVAARRGRPANK